MSSMTGIKAIGNYAGAANDSAAVGILLSLLADPDTQSSNGASMNGGAGAGFLDEMSPAALVQLRVELLALQAAVATTNTL